MKHEEIKTIRIKIYKKYNEVYLGKFRWETKKLITCSTYVVE